MESQRHCQLQLTLRAPALCFNWAEERLQQWRKVILLTLSSKPWAVVERSPQGPPRGSCRVTEFKGKPRAALAVFQKKPEIYCLSVGNPMHVCVHVHV